MKRLEGVDVARGLATVLMIQTHAYDAWVIAGERTSVGFRVSRGLGTLPLCTFLLLAGVSIGLRLQRGEVSRWPIVRRGLLIAAGGYAMSVITGLFDGAVAWDTLLRADVLQVIGFSIATLALLGLGTKRRWLLVAIAISFVALVICPFVTRAAVGTQSIMRFVLAPWVEVPGVTRFPVIPLIAWCGIGGVLGLFWREDTRALRWLALAAAITALLANVLTEAMLEALGGSLSRAHLAVWPNAIDFASRATVFVALTVLVTARIPSMLRTSLRQMGSASLLIYVVHLPFCYGRLGSLARGRLTMLEASVLVAILLVGCAGLAVLRERARSR